MCVRSGTGVVLRQSFDLLLTGNSTAWHFRSLVLEPWSLTDRRWMLTPALPQHAPSVLGLPAARVASIRHLVPALLDNSGRRRSVGLLIDALSAPGTDTAALFGGLSGAEVRC